MQKRIIPILISLMSIALIGIVFIQYRWIDRAVKEKQALIDNNVYLAINQVEEKLNDMRAMAFVSDSLFNDFNYGMNYIEVDDFGNIVKEDSSEEVEEVVAFDDDGNMIRSGPPAEESVQMEVSVITSDDREVWHDKEHKVSHKYEKHVIQGEDSITMIEIREGLGHLETVLNKIKFEFYADEDKRLDSAHVDKLLNEELTAKGLNKTSNWGIWDSKKATYIVQPKLGDQTDYSIPLFTTDVINPGRYDLRFSINNQNLIWNEIWPMVLMSALFILVISAVFAYSIKLVIKHKKISQIKSDFINNMTHEFKTPLASISLAADSLTHPNTALNKENVLKYVDIIQEEKNKLNAQVERILEVAALSKDALDIPIEKVPVSEVLQKAVKKFQLQLEQDNININYPSNAMMSVSANAFHLENVFVNLIENAVKYSNDKPEINIEIDEEKGIIKITDQGIGMDDKQLSKVFDNFYRVQSGDLHNTKGFGLGLSYCKLVIEKMGGEIYLQSKPHQGTTAIIQLNKV